MKHFTGIADAADAARIWIYSNANGLPTHSGSTSTDGPSIKQRLLNVAGTGSSPVDLCAVFVRAVYANRKAFSNEAKQVAAGIADLFAIDGYHERLSGKAAGMRLALLRDSGEKSDRAWPDPEQDPAVDADYAPPPPPAEPTAPAGE